MLRHETEVMNILSYKFGYWIGREKLKKENMIHETLISMHMFCHVIISFVKIGL